MSSLNNAPRTIKAALGDKLGTYASILTLCSALAGVFCATQIKDLSAAQDNLKAATAVITRADQNLTVEKNIDQPSSLNYTARYTPLRELLKMWLVI